MADNEIVIKTIESKRYPGVFLQAEGSSITTFQANGAGRVSTGHGKGPLDQFKLKSVSADIKSYVSTIEVAHQANLNLRMDGSAVKAFSGTGGGLVNLQLGHAAYEDFQVRVHDDGSVSFESTAHPGVFLSVHMPEESKETHPLINCQFGCGINEKFLLREPPATMSIRVLTYNTHLMKDSFLEMGAKISGDNVLFEDDIRREHIITKVIETQADIVSLQEVWALDWEKWIIGRFNPTYPYAYYGPTKNQGLYTGTSGVVLLSKFPLSENFTEGFPGMHGSEDMSQKGVLCATTDIPGLGKIRIGTTHAATDTGGTGCLNLVMLRERTTTDIAGYRDLPALYLGDFNAHPDKYPTQKSIFSFANTGVYAAADCWKEVHDSNHNGSTVDMRYNTLDQYFSPMRNTADPSVIDYIWAKSGSALSLQPTSASIPRDWNYISTSGLWCWAHDAQSSRGLSCAILGDRLCVVSESQTRKCMDGIQYSTFNKADMKWTHGSTGAQTVTGPGVVAFGGKFHMFYRHIAGNGILHRSSADGISWGTEHYIGYDTGGSVCPIVHKDKLYIFHCDSDGIGGQVRYITKLNSNDNWGKENFSGLTYIGITTHSNMSAASNGNVICVVTKEGFETGGVMRSVMTSDGHWSPTRIFDAHGGASSNGSPGILVMNGTFFAFYQDPNGNGILSAYSKDGLTWSDVNKYVNRDQALGAMTGTMWDGRMLLFYGYNRNAGGKKYIEDTLMHTEIGTKEVDLSDHYPMMTDIEIKKRTVLLNVSVHEGGIGNVLYTDGQWAGTKNLNCPLEGFSLHPLTGITLRYKARVSGGGEPEWKVQGEYAGTQGQSKLMQGFVIELTGESATKYTLSYKAHIQDRGDTDFVPAGTYCGTTEEKRVEALFIRLESK